MRAPLRWSMELVALSLLGANRILPLVCSLCHVVSITSINLNPPTVPAKLTTILNMRIAHVYIILCFIWFVTITCMTFVGLPLCMMFTKLLCMISMWWIVLFCPPSFGLVNCGIAPVHFLVPLWIVGTYWTSLARNAHNDLVIKWGFAIFTTQSSPVSFMNLAKRSCLCYWHWALCISIVLHVAYIVGLHHVYP